MTHALSEPVNWLDEFDSYTSDSCKRRFIARVLGHSGLTLAEAREVWLWIGYPLEHWNSCVHTIQAM